jgi:thiamine-phosphate pyrophosphorylase
VLRYAISPGALQSVNGAGADRLICRAVELSAIGVDYLLVREKRLSEDDLTQLSQRLVRELAGSDTRIIVPQSPAIALAAGAYGVHLSAGAAHVRISEVREAFPDAWISVSCHALDEVVRARINGADAALFAPVFGKFVDGVEVVSGSGIEKLHAACAVAGEMRVFALGGVHPGNMAECVAAGAAGVAGIRMFFG